MRETLDYDYSKSISNSIGRVCLEISLKPFFRLDDESIDEVCRTVFNSWKPFIRYAKEISVMFWTSDGSEILSYDGDLGAEFEWCKYIGIGNPKKHEAKNHPNKGSLHVQPVYYMENPVKFTYGDLKRIISAFKRIGKTEYGLDVCVGETFDPGPEFAYSEFKFERHMEISPGSTMSSFWTYCGSKLHADDYRYAAYPNGIPEGTHFGEFLAKQFAALSKDVGFDFIWLSNGFGYSLNSWDWLGEVFDGEKFYPSKTQKVREEINEFWRTFTSNLPDQTVWTRGSNLSTGMDISTHGCPIDDIYKNNIIAPPNSPWAPLNYRFGLELVGYMSHIASLPKGGFIFRYYTQDPWWINSPWFDRYAREPHDIYLPLAIARLDENGRVTPPKGINFLAVDDSFGQIPERLSVEVTPHLLTAYEDYPDAPSLLTWVYPFAEYCRLGLREGKPERIILGDWLMDAAVDDGFSLNGVIADENLQILLAKGKEETLKDSILVTEVPEADSALENTIVSALEKGLKVMLYGSTKFTSDRLRALIGVRIAEELSGTFTLDTHILDDSYETDLPSTTLSHDETLSVGGICEIADERVGAESLATALHSTSEQGRQYATYNGKALSGQLVWIRGSFPYSKNAGSLPGRISGTERFNSATLFRAALAKFGIKMAFDCFSCKDGKPIIFASKHDNATYFSGYCTDATVKAKLSFPYGAPAPAETDFIIENDVGYFPLEKWFHKECRVFIKQKQKAKISVKIKTVNDCLYVDRNFQITGLINADVTFFAPPDSKVIIREGWDAFWKGSNVDVERVDDICYRVKNFTGVLSIGWQKKGKFEAYKKLEIDGFDRES